MEKLIASYAGKTVVGFGAHPDDLEIAMGGTIARLVEAGARFIMVAVAVPGDLATRKVEARAAAKVLGAELEILEDERTSRVEDLAMHELVARMDRVVREYQPEAIFAHTPQDVHHDHVLAHRAAITTMRLKPMDVFCYGPSSCRPTIFSWQPRVWVDVSATIDRKVQSISAHSTQFDDRGICTQGFKDRARSTGVALGIPYAEGFDVVCLRT
ncbi:MAG: PIG-L deacetylase family protein [Planctomycetota bacterium]